MNRRKFLTILGSAGVASALGTATVARASGTVDYPYYPDSYGVLHDTTRCIGCRRCEEGCNEVNNLPKPAKSLTDLSVLNTKRRMDADAWTVVNKYHVGGKDVFRKAQCYHCNDPACASACFAKCFQKQPDGSVHYDGTQCVGCRYCMVACPFYVPSFQYHEAFDPVIRKCTFCQPRLKEGKLPGCVEACPMDALTFGKRSDLVKIAHKRVEANPERYNQYIFGEKDAGGTAWMTLTPAGVKADSLGLDTHLGNRPMGELTAGALGSVPMIVGFWPILFGGVYGITKAREALNKKAQDEAVAAAQASAEAAMKDAIARIEKEQGPETAAKVQQAMTKPACSCGDHGKGA